MASFRTQSGRADKGWSTYPDLYVLVRRTPTVDMPNYAQVSCEWLQEGNPAAGEAMSVYLSPFDACIDAAMRSTRDQRYHAIEADRFDPCELIEANHGALHTIMHCGWGANDGRLVVRRGGYFVNLSAYGRLDVASDGTVPIRLEIGHADLTAYGRMREQAGLFAHAEAHGSFLALCESHRQGAVRAAIESVPGTVDLNHEITQMAFYDPEAAQWHFLPIGAFYEASEVAMTGAQQDA